MDDETSFFERERDKLTREITAVRLSYHLPWISLIERQTAGIRRTIVL